MPSADYRIEFDNQAAKDVKKLHHIYELYPKQRTIHIIRIGHRKDIYR